MNTYTIYEEYTIIWFEFDMCGLVHQQYATDSTLDNDNGRERTFQIQEQVRENITGQ